MQDQILIVFKKNLIQIIINVSFKHYSYFI